VASASDMNQMPVAAANQVAVHMALHIEIRQNDENESISFIIYKFGTGTYQVKRVISSFGLLGPDDIDDERLGVSDRFEVIMTHNSTLDLIIQEIVSMGLDVIIINVMLKMGWSGGKKTDDIVEGRIIASYYHDERNYVDEKFVTRNIKRIFSIMSGIHTNSGVVNIMKSEQCEESEKDEKL
jgi:hypothetical protein